MTDGEVEQALISHRSQILRYAKALTKDPDEAADIVQETYEAAWKHRHKFNVAKAAFGTWLITIYHNVVRRRFRLRSDELKDVSLISLEDLVLDEEDEETSLDCDNKIELEQALNTLGGIHAAVIRRCFIGGSTFQEVADELGLTKRKVRRLVTTGLKRLKGILSHVEQQQEGNPLDAASDDAGADERTDSGMPRSN